MGSVTDKLSDIANDAVNFTKDTLHGRFGDAFEDFKDLGANVVPGGEISRRFIDNHPLEAAAVIATIVTAGAASPTLAGVEGAGEVAGTAATADSVAAGATGTVATGEATQGGLIKTAMDAGAMSGPMPAGVEAGTGVDAINSGAQAVTKGLAVPAGVEGGAALDAMAQGGLTAGAAAGGAALGATTGAPEVASSAPGTTEATNAAFGSGTTAAQTVQTDPGTIARILGWAKENQTLAAGMLTGAGMTLGGAAKGAADYMTAEKKAELDRETLLEVARQKPLLYQQFVRQSSAGGGGVTIPFGATAQRKPLSTQSGQPVFGQGGLIGSRLGG